MTKPEAVTQEDRDLFAGLVAGMDLLSELTAEHIRRGLYDGDVLRFVTPYRIAAEQRGIEQERERCAGVVVNYTGGMTLGHLALTIRQGWRA